MSDFALTNSQSPNQSQNLATSLRWIEINRPVYWLPKDPFDEEVLIPGFKVAENVDCLIGFFSSHALASIAPGLATYINRSLNSFRLIICPVLSEQDLKAISEGVRSADDVAQGMLEEIIVTEDLIQQHTLKCLTYLLRTGRIEIQIAIMTDAIFHPKIWLFRSGEDVIAAHGSGNATYGGIKKNVEQIVLSRSWIDPNQRWIAEDMINKFHRFWDNKEDSCTVISLPKAVKENLIRIYGSGAPPTEDDLRKLSGRDTDDTNDEKPYEIPLLPNPVFAIPSDLRFDDGPFAHQGKAVAAWCNAGYRGVLEMATGSGKTITAMICAHRLYEEHKPLLIVVAAPYKPLIQQWCEEIHPFGLRPINLTLASGKRGRAIEINRIKRSLRNKMSDVEIVVVSNRTLCDPSFKSEIEKFDCARLLIADEAHNLGSEGFISDPPEFFEYRLGLSATPVRQYDDEGTDALFRYFGTSDEPVFRFTLKQAIGLCLVEYDYFVHPVELTGDEMDDWYEITAKIKSNSWRKDNGKPDTYLQKLYRDRRLLLETARNKIGALETALNDEDQRTLRHTLIYASDKAPEQLEAVNSLLKSKGILFHQLTQEETGNPEETVRIIRSFQDGTLSVITAKRVLDEGVNIPQIEKGYILASTTVERQWVQRRGRLLRTCRETGKDHSEIHDFIAMPPDLDHLDDEARDLVKSELLRVQAFASLARNAGRSDGPLELISQLIKVAFM